MKYYLTVLLVILFCSQVFGYLTIDGASKFISEEEHYLTKGESTEFIPNKRIQFEKDNYWVVNIVNGDAFIGLIAIKDGKNPKVENKLTTNRALFKTVFIIRNFSDTKQKLANQNQWLFTLSNAEYFDTLSRLLESEKNELQIIKSDISNTAIVSKVNSIIAKLDTMKNQTDVVSEGIRDAISFESNFFTTPNAKRLDEFISIFQLDDEDSSSLLKKLKNLQETAFSYDSDVTQLKSMISRAKNIDAAQKNSLVKLANPPSPVFNLNTYVSVASNNKQNLESIFIESDSQVSNIIDALKERDKMNTAFKAIYSDDIGIEKYNRNVKSLNRAATDILSKDNKDTWKNQAEVVKLDKKWKEIESEFEEERYENVLLLVNAAKTSVKKIYSKGFRADSTRTDTQTQQSLLEQLSIPIAVLLVGLVLFRFKNQILKYFVKKENNTESDDYNFESGADESEFKKQW